MKTAILAVGSCVLAGLLSACGGSSSTANIPTINQITADQQIYRKTTTFTVVGQNLDQGIQLSSPGCTNVKLLTASTAANYSTTQQFTCKVIGVGYQPVTISNSSGTALSSAFSLLIPLLTQPQVTMVTSEGSMSILLYPQYAPITVDNFLDYVENSAYNNTIFHRVGLIPPATTGGTSIGIVQGGGYVPGTNYPSTITALTPPTGVSTGITTEVGTTNGITNSLTNVQYSLAMANTGAANSATSQFYFNAISNSPGLDTGYAVFGTIAASADGTITQAAGQATLAALYGVKTENYVLNSTTTFANLPVSPIYVISTSCVPTTYCN